MIIFQKVKRVIYDIIEQHSIEEKSKSIFFNHFIVALILLNVLSIVLESFENLYLKFNLIFRYFELFSIAVFSVEYLLRLWTADLKIKCENRLYSKLLFMISPLAIIDLLAILPFYLPMLIPFDLRFLRILRIVRLLRVLKLARYSKVLNLIGKILKDKKDELIVTFFMTFILLLVASTLMYYIEHDAQPDAFPNIIVSLWWAIATLTTVGYGDVYPVTGWGRLLSGIIAILGIGFVALPTGIISSSFMKELSIKTKEEYMEKPIKNCPHCGKKIKN
jgi:voltage-gated potassium channel